MRVTCRFALVEYWSDMQCVVLTVRVLLDQSSLVDEPGRFFTFSISNHAYLSPTMSACLRFTKEVRLLCGYMHTK